MTVVVFNWYGPELAFEILRVVGSYLGARVYFTLPCKDDANLRNPEFYTIEHADSDLVGFLDVYSVTPEDTEFPTYVDLECSDLTDGKVYLLTITSDKVLDSSETKYITAPNNAAEYDGVSIFPQMVDLQSTSEQTMLVTFNKDMSPTDPLFNPSAYTFTGGLIVYEVVRISPGVMELRTSKQTPSVLYELTVASAS